MSRPVRQLQLPAHMVNLLTARNMLTARDVLCHSITDLMELLDVTYSTAQQLYLHVSAQIAPAYITAAQLYSNVAQAASHVTTGLPGLDAALRRGMPAGAVTELVGPAGVGKSQWCFCLALRTALPRSLGGLGAAVMYIDTEDKFSAQRLQDMARQRLAGAAAPVGQGGAGLAGGCTGGLVDVQAGLQQVLNRVLVMQPHSTQELSAALEALDGQVAARGIGLVVLDSVAALLRTGELGGGPGSGADGGGGGSGVGRAALLARQEAVGRYAVALKRLAEAHHIPVVVTNQVTARPTAAAAHAFQQQQRGGGSGGGDSGQLAAALGTKWAHCVNVRLVLERHGGQRFVRIAKSPLSASVAFEYAITAAGPQQVGDGPVACAGQLQQSAIEVSIGNTMAPDNDQFDQPFF